MSTTPCKIIQQRLHRLAPGSQPDRELQEHCRHCEQCAPVWKQTQGLVVALQRSPVTVRGAEHLADRFVAGLPETPAKFDQPTLLRFPVMVAAGVAAAAAAVLFSISMLASQSNEPSSAVVTQPIAGVTPAEAASADAPMPTSAEVREVLAWLRVPTDNDMRELLAVSNPLTVEVEELQADGRALGSFITGALRPR